MLSVSSTYLDWPGVNILFGFPTPGVWKGIQALVERISKCRYRAKGVVSKAANIASCMCGGPTNRQYHAKGILPHFVIGLLVKDISIFHNCGSGTQGQTPVACVEDILIFHNCYYILESGKVYSTSEDFISFHTLSGRIYKIYLVRKDLVD